MGAMKIEYPSKNRGDLWRSSEANEVKEVVNNNADELAEVRKAVDSQGAALEGAVRGIVLNGTEALKSAEGVVSLTVEKGDPAVYAVMSEDTGFVSCYADGTPLGDCGNFAPSLQFMYGEEQAEIVEIVKTGGSDVFVLRDVAYTEDRKTATVTIEPIFTADGNTRRIVDYRFDGTEAIELTATVRYGGRETVRRAYYYIVGVPTPTLYRLVPSASAIVKDADGKVTAASAGGGQAGTTNVRCEWRGVTGSKTEENPSVATCLYSVDGGTEGVLASSWKNGVTSIDASKVEKYVRFRLLVDDVEHDRVVIPVIVSGGEKGEKGDTGEQGPQGGKGEKGDTGEKGEMGDAAPTYSFVVSPSALHVNGYGQLLSADGNTTDTLSVSVNAFKTVGETRDTSYIASLRETITYADGQQAVKTSNLRTGSTYKLSTAWKDEAHGRITGLQYRFQNYGGGNVIIETKTIPIIQDGSRGEDGQDGSNGQDGHSPKVVDNVWYEWSDQQHDYVSTGITASGITEDEFETMAAHVLDDRYVEKHDVGVNVARIGRGNARGDINYEHIKNYITPLCGLYVKDPNVTESVFCEKLDAFTDIANVNIDNSLVIDKGDLCVYRLVFNNSFGDWELKKIGNYLPTSGGDISGTLTVGGTPVLTGNSSVLSLTADVSDLQCPATLSQGEQYTLMLVNDDSDSHTVTVSSGTYRTPDGGDLSINITPGGYGEVVWTRVGGEVFVRIV